MLHWGFKLDSLICQPVANLVDIFELLTTSSQPLQKSGNKLYFVVEKQSREKKSYTYIKENV